MIIDATNLIVGRLASFVAKKALLGEKIDIINCELAIITGSRKNVFDRFKQYFDRGIPLKGPYFPRQPDRLLRRMIRGMVPYKQAKGRDAYERIMCWKGVPTQFVGQKAETVASANVSKLPNLKFITLGEISKFLGGKVE